MNKIFLLLFIFFINNASADDDFLSLKNTKVNVRYGPGFDYQVKYIYKKLNLPVKIIDKKENFRRIIDIKNNSGWVHISQLKKSNSLITLIDKIIFKEPTLFSKPIVKIKKGRLLIIKKCKKKWCRVQTEDYLGWIEINDVWGNY